MAVTSAASTDDDTPTKADAQPIPVEDARPRRWERWFGPLTPLKLVALLAAVLFLGFAAGYAFRERESQAPSSVDVGFLRDMSTHHDQAVLIARAALASGLPDGVAVYAEEVVMFQRYELGLMQATLYRYDEDPVGDGTAMGWMDMPVPDDQMPGLATEEELARLRDLDGEAAAELFLALMTRHHLGGAHMAKAAAENAKDTWVRNLAEGMARNQVLEIREYRAARARFGLGLPDGYPELPDPPVPAERSGSGGRSLGLFPVVGLLIVVGALVGALGPMAGRNRFSTDDDDSPPTDGDGVLLDDGSGERS